MLPYIASDSDSTKPHNPKGHLKTNQVFPARSLRPARTAVGVARPRQGCQFPVIPVNIESYE
jgi:hypothetical protein